MGNNCCTSNSEISNQNQIATSLVNFKFPHDPIYAVCILESSEKREVYGYVYFKQIQEKVKIRAQIKGLSKGKHGFHVHQYGNLSKGCASAGAHFNPTNSQHGGPTSNIRHVGDLGNINNPSGVDEFVEYEFYDHLIALCGPYNIIGRSCVVHQDEDDYGLGNHDDSKTTGHAGARVACGVIGLSDKFSFEF